jgi:hypothetical protein
LGNVPLVFLKESFRFATTSLNKNRFPKLPMVRFDDVGDVDDFSDFPGKLEVMTQMLPVVTPTIG